MPNRQKQLTAKAAWGQLSAERARLRHALEQIYTLLSDVHFRSRSPLRDRVRYIAAQALQPSDKKAA